jgi:hypothetical protein
MPASGANRCVRKPVVFFLEVYLCFVLFGTLKVASMGIIDNTICIDSRSFKITLKPVLI